MIFIIFLDVYMYISIAYDCNIFKTLFDKHECSISMVIPVLCILQISLPGAMPDGIIQL